MNQMESQLLSRVNLMTYSIGNRLIGPTYSRRTAVHEVFEAEARAKAARAEESPLVRWARLVSNNDAGTEVRKTLTK